MLPTGRKVRYRKFAVQVQQQLSQKLARAAMRWLKQTDTIARGARACPVPAPVARNARLRGPIDHAARRCRSSVVEHPLGKGEVESSILSGSTRNTKKISMLLRCFSGTTSCRANLYPPLYPTKMEVLTSVEASSRSASGWWGARLTMRAAMAGEAEARLPRALPTIPPSRATIDHPQRLWDRA